MLLSDAKKSFRKALLEMLKDGGADAKPRRSPAGPARVASRRSAQTAALAPHELGRSGARAVTVDGSAASSATARW